MTKDDYLTVGRNASGNPLIRVQLLRWIAKAVGIQFTIGGLPFGASYERAINHQPTRGRAIEYASSVAPSTAR